MNWIGELINDSYPEYEFQNTITLGRILREIVPVTDKNDIQFLFEEPICSDIGHWICICFNYLEKKVYIFDSANSGQLTAKHRAVLKKLYPTIDLSSDIIFKPLKYCQKPASTCGVFAAVYAITLVLGKDPSQMNFKIYLNGSNSDEAKFLQSHLLKIAEDSKLSLFPEH